MLWEREMGKKTKKRHYVQKRDGMGVERGMARVGGREKDNTGRRKREGWYG